MRLIVTMCLLFMGLNIEAVECYGKKDPIGVYVNFEIHDKAWENVNIARGAPKGIQWSGNNELFVNKNMRWESTKWKTWVPDEDQMDIKRREIDRLEKEGDRLQEKGTHASSMKELQSIGLAASILSKKLEKILNKPDPFKVEDTNYIEVKTPDYDLYFEKVNNHGYGNRKVDPRYEPVSEKQTHGAGLKIATQVLGVDKLIRFLGKSTKIGSKKILGYTCELRRIDSPAFDLFRKYQGGELCFADIQGHKIFLYTRLGSGGNEYRETAVKIDEYYHLDRKNICVPTYVKLD